MSRKIEILAGTNLDDVIQILLKARKNGESVYCDFQNRRLYSDAQVDTENFEDYAYKVVTGKTKSEYIQWHMQRDEKYLTKIEIPETANLDDVIQLLSEAKENGILSFCDFQGHRLYSNFRSIDEIYFKVTGFTRTEFLQQQQVNKVVEEKISNWIQKGQNIIFPERYEEWKNFLNTYASSPFYGPECIDLALNVMELLETGMTLDEVITGLNRMENFKEYFLPVRNIVFMFSSKGPEFWRATAETISPETEAFLAEKIEENKELSRIHEQTSKKKI